MLLALKFEALHTDQTVKALPKSPRTNFYVSYKKLQNYLGCANRHKTISISFRFMCFLYSVDVFF